MPQLSQSEIQSRIRAESEQITQEFGDRVDPKTLAKCVDAAQGLVAGSRIPDFAPIFFRRHARRLIREVTAEIPGGSAAAYRAP